MPFIELNDLTEHEIVPGFHGRFVHSANMTLSSWQIDAGAILPEHAHPHEQISIVLEGEFTFTLVGETRTVRPGSVIVIPANVKHSGKAITPCRFMDVFYPAREDYRK
ncbi:MAG: cupin domain-containing protein [Chloroflexi bacterium]|nr:cupin domain-containing protein [Chloroflexota bacterium]